MKRSPKLSPKIGASVLETLTTGMYLNPLDTVRELVQNAADSIRKAQVERVLPGNAGRIETMIGQNNRSLSIRDNGLGIPAKQVSSKLLNVGMSDKDVEQDAGFRGIGRLAGIAFCNCLRFKTSAKGEARATVLEFDCVGIRNAISPRENRKHEMADVLAKYSTVSTERCKKADHFFEVALLEIDDSSTQFLNPSELETYLSKTAPVDFDPQDFYFASTIQQWVKKNGLVLPTISLTITAPSGPREVFKPYLNTYQTSHQRNGRFDIKIEDVAFHLDESNGGPRFWIWYGVSDLPGTIDNRQVAGFQLRKNNILLGGAERMTELFREVSSSYGRFNAYYIGEIHVLCPNAIPNARRDGFENIGTWPLICRELLPFVKNRCNDAYQASKDRNLPVQKLKASAEKILAKADSAILVGLASEDERDKRLEEVRKTREKAEQWVDTNKKPGDARKIKTVLKRLTETETKLQDEKHFMSKKIRPSLDQKQRKLLQDVAAVIYSTLEGQNCKKAAQCGEAVRKAISRKYGKK